MANEDLLFARFYVDPVEDKKASAKAGRPIFKDRELCEIRAAANKQTVWRFPAHEICQWVTLPDGSRDPQTYAMRFPEQYKKFKANEVQTASGTPLSELPFLTASKRLELKALSIHTGEALAMLDGVPLKQLGIGGRELKNQAAAYLANAAGSADVTRFAAENAALKAGQADMQRQIAELTALVKDGKPQAPAAAVSVFADWSVEDLKNWLADKTGARPKGNPSLATLVQMADEINTAKVEEAA